MKSIYCQILFIVTLPVVIKLSVVPARGQEGRSPSNVRSNNRFCIVERWRNLVTFYQEAVEVASNVSCVMYRM